MKRPPGEKGSLYITRIVDAAPDLEGSACELLAYFMADAPLQKLCAKYHFQGIGTYYDYHMEQRILRLMIEIAATYRLHSWRLTGERRKTEEKKCVGSLFIGDKDGPVDLSMHEACNKIIHAEELLYETRKVRRSTLAYVRDSVLAAGELRGVKWEAHIWIPEFCDAALLVPHLLHESKQPKRPEKQRGSS